MGDIAAAKHFAALLALLLLTAAIAGCGDVAEESAPSAEEAEQDTAAQIAVEPADGEAEQSDATAAGQADGEAQDGADQAEPDGQYLVWVEDREPPDLHFDDPLNDMLTISWIRAALLEGLFGVDQHTAYYPELLAAEPTLTRADNGRVTIDYRLRDGLTWSDGTPLTAADVDYTFAIITEGCAFEADGSVVDGSIDGCVYLMADRIGYDLITELEVTGATTFTVTMASFFPGWRSLFPEIYAAHAFGANATEVNDNLREMTSPRGVLPASGPMTFTQWNHGQSLLLVRNDRYHGSTNPDATNPGPARIDGVRVLFVTDTEAQIAALQDGSAHLIMTPPRLDLLPLVRFEGFTVAASTGSKYEHWGLNLLNVHLAKPAVRQALALALDKSALVAELYRPLLGDHLPAEGQGNTYWMAHQQPYLDHQEAYAGANIAAAEALLEEAGYEKGTDGIYRHPSDGRLTLRVGTTGGDELREAQQRLIQVQMAPAGIEIIFDNVAGGAYFGERPFARDAMAASASGGREGDSTIWDITQFAWLGDAWPGGQSGAYRAGSASNPYGFNNPEFGGRASECDATVDDAERAACYNDLDLYVTTLDKGEDGLFMLPLTVKPSFFGYKSDRLMSVGAASDAEGAGPLLNVVDYQFG